MEIDRGGNARPFFSAAENLARGLPYMELPRDKYHDAIADGWIAYWHEHCGEKRGRDFIVQRTARSTVIYRGTYGSIK